MTRSPTYSEEELIEALRGLNEKVRATPPRKRDMNEQGPHSARTYQLRFGSWSAAVAAAGFEPREKGADYTARPEVCPLCTTEDTGLDWHHWRYGNNEIGCYLCRDCHDRIHEGEAHTDNPDWLIHAIENLVATHQENHDEVSTNLIIQRYNLPDIEDLVKLSIQRLDD